MDSDPPQSPGLLHDLGVLSSSVAAPARLPSRLLNVQLVPCFSLPAVSGEERATVWRRGPGLGLLAVRGHLPQQREENFNIKRCLCLQLIDHAKAFDCVDDNTLWKIL